MQITQINYETHVDTLVQLGIPSQNIYKNWDEDDLKNLQNKFNMYQGYLESGERFAKENSYFYFSEDYSLGGGATKIRENYFIKIYIGTFNRLHDLFATNENIFDVEGLEIIKDVNGLTDFPINELMRDICLHFTYYHELAHLHQDSQYLSNGMHEEHNDANFEYSRHLLEYDADIFSALSLSTHIFQYFDNWHHRKTLDDLEEITSILVAAILIRILLSPGIRMDFYTEETTHPHWIVRMINIIEIISNHTGKIADAKYQIGKIDSRKVIRKSLAYTNILNDTLSLGIILGDISKMVVDNAKTIEVYINKLTEDIKIMNNSSWVLWNARSSN